VTAYSVAADTTCDPRATTFFVDIGELSTQRDEFWDHRRPESFPLRTGSSLDLELGEWEPRGRSRLRVNRVP